MIQVEARSLGRDRTALPDLSVPLPDGFGAEGVTLRDLIERVVRGEVAAFRERQEDERLVRFLSAGEIAEGAARGKVETGGRDLAQEVDVDQAVATALQGFEDGLYLVVVDGDEKEDLDAEVFLRPDSRLTFLRLTFLAGG